MMMPSMYDLHEDGNKVLATYTSRPITRPDEQLAVPGTTSSKS